VLLKFARSDQNSFYFSNPTSVAFRKKFLLQIGPLPFVGLPPAYGLTVAAVSVAGMGLGAQLVAAFSEAHRYEVNVAAVSKTGMGTGG
jgi:hypothetical protein